VNSTALRARYLNDSVTTASPSRLLCMLYDRLVLDLERAATALADGPLEAAPHLRHAQEIVLSLRASLDVDAWSGAAGLAALYDFLVRELLLVQSRCDPERLQGCLELVRPLRDTWHEAADMVRAQGARIPAPRQSA
jgi:flagellar protein FliS